MVVAALWVLVVVSAVGMLISSLNHALREYSVVRLQEIVESRGGSVLVDRILADVPGHILATGFLRSLCNVAITVCAVVLFRAFQVESTADGPAVALHWWSLLGAFAVASVVIYLLGMVIPMSVAEHAGERLIVAFAGPLRVIHALAVPLRALSIIDTAVKRLVGAAHMTKQAEVQEEIISAAAEGERAGQLDEHERSMIEAIVSFRERTVEEIMTPRTEIEGLELTDDLAVIRKAIESTGHSRIPVYQGDLDHIVGILYAKDLIRYVGTDPGAFRLKPVLRRPVWVPETKPLTELLRELRARKVHLAIVLDEYGGTTGLVTFEDLLEEIVGEIQDEYEPAHDTLPVIGVKPEERTAEVDARANIDDVNRAIEPLGVEIPEGEEYDTIGGFVLTRLGHIPVAGESFEDDGYRVVVLAAEPTRVTKLRIEAVFPLEPAEADAAASADSPAQPDGDENRGGASIKAA